MESFPGTTITHLAPITTLTIELMIFITIISPEIMKSIARIIFLDVPVGEIKQRIGDTSERGVVIHPGMTLADLHAERRPLYLEYADVVIDCSGKPQDAVLAEIQALT